MPRDDALRTLFNEIAASSSGKLGFSVTTSGSLAQDFELDLAQSRNPVYVFTVTEPSGEQLTSVAFTLALDGRLRPATRAEALGKNLADSDGQLFELNPFLLVYDYTGLRLLAVPAIDLFGAFAERAAGTVLPYAANASFSLTPNFQHSTVFMYAEVREPIVWASSATPDKLSADELAKFLRRVSQDTTAKTNEIPLIIEAVKTRLRAAPGDSTTSSSTSTEEAATPLQKCTPANQSPDPHSAFNAEALGALASGPPYLLQIDLRVYRAIDAAIMSGKHIILTGPPGTAKTTLAELTCELATTAGLCSGYALTTATADWTTYETIGGLRPAELGTSLEFRPGQFLDASRSGKWLVVDELNRANFDRAFGQLFTVLSGQSVALPYEDPASGLPIVLAFEDAATHYNPANYAHYTIPNTWRIIATMNVFDKSLLFEMSFALMRRFAFIEVPSPSDSIFADVWTPYLRDLPTRQAEAISELLAGFLALRAVKDIGPAVFIDMAKFARRYLEGGSAAGQELAFQLFYSYLLPQFEGVSNLEGIALYNRVRHLVGSQHRDRLRKTLTGVLGVVLPSAPQRVEEEIDIEADADEVEQQLLSDT